MSLHKLTAGDGYTYLTRQVAAHDRTDRGHSSLGEYYAEKGESPGRWWGAGLTGVSIDPGELVSEAQMLNLFGHGRHPNAPAGPTPEASGRRAMQPADHPVTLGQPFRVYNGPATEFMQEVARRFTADNRANGRHWQAAVPPEVRARIRTDVADELFANKHGRSPLDQRERAGFLARESRHQTRAVAGYDLTFTPVKSVSALWALADRELAGEIARAHDAAVTSALTWLEAEGLFTRQGHNGIQQVPARGLLATRFVHRDSRAGDPNLHTHVAISNKCQTLDGRWLAVDGRSVHSLAVSVSELYNSRLEAELSQRIGLRFTPRPRPATGSASAVERSARDVREVFGLDPRLLKAWSKRSVMIEARRRELASRFQDEHGRPPTVVESIALAQQANLETRQAKHEPRSEAEQRQQWRIEAIAVLGDASAVDDMVARTLRGEGLRPTGRPKSGSLSRSRVRRLAKTVVRAVESDRATWQEWHLRAEALRQTRRLEIPGHALETTIDRVVRTAVGRCVPFTEPDPLLTTQTPPAPLQRPEGESVYVQHRSTRYTSARIMQAEERILEAAQRTDGRRVAPTHVDLALARAAASGTRLTTAQDEMVRQMACSGRRLELALAPAGTGKTTALSAVTDAWRTSGGRVIGLAPSAVAAHQLRLAIDPAHHVSGPSDPSGEAVVSDTLAKLVHSLKPETSTPAWVASIDRRTLILIDEAGMAATIDLATVIDHAMQRGASVKLIGDDRQLGAVQAGGILRDLAHNGPLTTLTEVRRFPHPAEAAATLALREGDPSALGFYADHQRIHVGDTSSCMDQAYQAWAADNADGHSTILLAPTRE
ncbi:MAG: MobF family relaxase, partial [Propionibacteriaceae bacterium]